MNYPVSRKLITVNPSGKGTEIKIMSYNLLAQTGLRRDQFSYASSNCLKWTYRKNILLKEVVEAKSDIYCFQECDSKYYKEMWLPQMDKLGYKSQFKPKTVKAPDQSFGIAIFYKSSMFEELKYEALEFDDVAKGLTGVHLEEMSRTNVGQVIVLKLKGEESEQRGIILGNVHLFWHPKYDWVRLKQVEMLIDKLLEVQKNFKFSIFAVGDFNSTPDTRIYKFLTTSQIEENQFPKFFLPEDHSDPNVSNVNMVAQADLNGTLMSNLNERKPDPERIEGIKAILQKAQQYPKFMSAYSKYTDLTGGPVSKFWVGEPVFTSYTQWKGTLDYIFFDPLKKEEKDSLILKSIVEIPSEEIVSKQKGLPSDEFGSDHVSIMAVFELL